MTSPTLASAPDNCCVVCFKHTGTPTGSTTTIAGVNTYVSEPKQAHPGSEKKVILFFADVFGPVHLNNQLIQDYFAEHGIY
jgi:hypothetical protein